MLQINGSKNFPADISSPVVALGNFDGVHIAHRTLIALAHERARAIGGTSVVYTFDPHPAKALAPAETFRLIQTLEQRIAQIGKLGIDICVIEPFSAEFARAGAEDFFERVIVSSLHAREIVAGYDFTFGLHREGSAETLNALGNERGILVHIVKAQFLGETLISSSNIRRLVAEGNVEEAAKLLGRLFLLAGKVVKGRGAGSSLGARTANIEPFNELIPGDGVYLTMTSIPRSERRRKVAWRPRRFTRATLARRSSSGGSDERRLRSITSIGSNPTFPHSSFTIETHLIGEEIELLESVISVEFIRKMRDQIAFASFEELKEQIGKDLKKAKVMHKGPGIY